MMLLPLLDVVFVGLVGADPGHVQNQLGTLLAKDSVTQKSAPAADINALTHQTAASPGVCKKIGADGIVASEIVVQHGQHSLVVVVYDGTGNLLSMSETPFAGKALAAGDLQMIQDNLGDDVAKLVNKGKKTAKKDAAKKAPAPVAATAPMTAKSRTRAQAPRSEDDPLAGTKPHTAAPPDRRRHRRRAGRERHRDRDARSRRRVARPRPARRHRPRHQSSRASRPGRRNHRLRHLGRRLGPRRRRRRDRPAPHRRRDVRAHDLDAHRNALGDRPDVNHPLGGPRRLRSPPRHGQGRAAGRLRPPRVESHHHRSDGDAERRLPLPRHRRHRDRRAVVEITLFGSLAYEPVLGGVDIANNTLGDASRWGIDLAAGVEVRPVTHIYVRAVGEYQSFAWSWQMASGWDRTRTRRPRCQLGARY